jgi:opacity protein-like surface antigen
MMKRGMLFLAILAALLLLTAVIAQAAPPNGFDSEGNEISWNQGNSNACTTIQDGTLLTSDNQVIVTGYDQWGYNYQAHMFNGTYCDAYRDAAWCQAYSDVELIMKWNDAWLSNEDCSGDGLLDRHPGFTSYIGSGAWLTNHQAGTYEGDNGQTCNWTYFVKIVAAPADAELVGGIWYAADGTEIGPEIWSGFAVIEDVTNDPCAGMNGLQYHSPDHSGLGNW